MCYKNKINPCQPLIDFPLPTTLLQHKKHRFNHFSFWISGYAHMELEFQYIRDMDVVFNILRLLKLTWQEDIFVFIIIINKLWGIRRTNSNNGASTAGCVLRQHIRWLQLLKSRLYITEKGKKSKKKSLEKIWVFDLWTRNWGI